MNKKTSISNFVSVAPRYLRSVNLTNDRKSAESFTGYIITENVAQSLYRLVAGLLDTKGQRAYTLIGPYGTGKSAFTVYLCQLLAHDDNYATASSALLKGKHLKLAKDFELARLYKKGLKGFLPITVTARRRPLAQLILEALLESLVELEKTKTVQQLIADIESAIDQNFWKDTATVIKYIQSLGIEAQAQGYLGQLLIIDEAGKTLEYALMDKEGGDVYVFQEIAEYANRQKERPLLFLITLHQMFDDYVELAERTIRAEWTKVQERFQPIQFAESATTTIEMIANALYSDNSRPTSIDRTIDKAIQDLEKSSTPLPIGLNITKFRDLAFRAWPLHPTVLLAIPHLFRRLAQNERSIFSYLNSQEPFGFQDHLQREIEQDSGFVRMQDLYAYLLANFEAGLARLPVAKRLLEANDVINSRHNLTTRQYELVRTVAILNVLGDISPLRGTLSLLECSVSNGKQIESDLETLKQQSVLTYRHLDRSYRVWEGSNVDIDEKMKEARLHLKMEGGALYETLKRHLPQRTFVARRHSLETGAHRYFNVLYGKSIDTPDSYVKMNIPEGTAGVILILFPHTDNAVLRSSAEKATQAQPRLIIAHPRQIDVLKSVVEEVACLRWVADNTEELRDDRVARRELSLRLVEGEQKIAQLLQLVLDPRPAPIGNTCQWYWNGREQALQTPLATTQLLSLACDEIYTKSPRLKNELIARTTTSSAASSARRCLIEKMLTSAEHERFGIEGYPPERSIYESVLHASEIHICDTETGIWKLQGPPIGNIVNLRPCWDLLELEIFSNQVKKIDLETVFKKLAEAPYGLPRGVHSILFTAFYLLNQDDLFLYREGSFLPDPQPGHFELLQRRPDLFSISGIRLEGIRRQVVVRLAEGLNTPSKTASVVRGMFRVINGLPVVTMKSSRFDESEVSDMRERFLQARSPEELLFTALPECFGMKPFNNNGTSDTDVNLFFDKLNGCLIALQNHAYDLQITSRDILLNMCNLPKGNDGWAELERRSLVMSSRINHEVITPFMKSIANGIGDNHSPKPALSFIANRSFDNWTDLDVDRFPGLAEGVGQLFQKSWKNFGGDDTNFTKMEVEEKEKLHKLLEPQLRKIRRQASFKPFAAALREILEKLENEPDNK